MGKCYGIGRGNSSQRDMQDMGAKWLEVKRGSQDPLAQTGALFGRALVASSCCQGSNLRMPIVEFVLTDRVSGHVYGLVLSSVLGEDECAGKAQ